jgi:glutaminyl-peptide cyclotransferase
VDSRSAQLVTAQRQVLNGIAYDEENARLFVTGKYWATLYEIELIEQ